MLDVTLKDLITLIGFLLLLYNQNRSTKKDAEEKTANWVKVNLKLDTLCQSNTAIKDALRDLERGSQNMDKRLSILEEQIKVANHRIDDLERG